MSHSHICPLVVILFFSAFSQVAGYPLTWDGLDPFHQPVSTTDYYGSGDVSLDGIVNADDLAAVTAMAQNPISNKPNYRADVNGDGLVSDADAEIVNRYLNGTISYLPGWWNDLTTIEERVDWVQKMIVNVYKTNYPQGYIKNWSVCGDFADQVLSLGTFRRVDYKNAKSGGPNNLNYHGQTFFNLPFYFMRTTVNGIGHAEAMILVGDNPSNLLDWQVVDCIDGRFYGRSLMWILNTNENSGPYLLDNMRFLQ